MPICHDPLVVEGVGGGGSARFILHQFTPVSGQRGSLTFILPAARVDICGYGYDGP